MPTAFFLSFCTHARLLAKRLQISMAWFKLGPKFLGWKMRRMATERICIMSHDRSHIRSLHCFHMIFRWGTTWLRMAHETTYKHYSSAPITACSKWLSPPVRITNRQWWGTSLPVPTATNFGTGSDEASPPIRFEPAVISRLQMLLVL